MTVKRLEMLKELKSKVLQRSPSTIEIYLRSLWRMMGRSQGDIPKVKKGMLCPIRVIQSGVRIDPDRLKLYRRVCETPDQGLAVPPAYPECLFLTPMAEIVLSEGFPLSPFGLIHIGQRIAILRPIDPDAKLDLSCQLEEIREADRGFEVDLELYAFEGGQKIWEGRTTLLSRNRRTRSGGQHRQEKPIPWIREDKEIRLFTIHVAEDTGRRYARASGDWNPHHLYPITARLLGYRRAIAHGMWALSRTLGLIERECPFEFPLEAEATFKRPIFLPSDIEIRYQRNVQADQTPQTLRFELRNPHTGEPHMIGSIQTELERNR